MSKKFIYFFGNGMAEGDASPEKAELPGNKGVHSHEMTALGLLMPPGCTSPAKPILFRPPRIMILRFAFSLILGIVSLVLCIAWSVGWHVWLIGIWEGVLIGSVSFALGILVTANDREDA